MNDAVSKPTAAERTRFSVLDLPPNERFAAWKESISCIFDVEADRADRSGDFRATLDAVMLGPVMLARCHTIRQRFARTAATIARDGMDHYMVQIYESGSQSIEHRHGTLRHRRGDILVYDLAQPMAARTDDFTNLSLIVPRELLSDRLGRPECHHMRLLDRNAPLTALLRDFMRSVARRGDELDATQAAEIAPSALGLVSAALNGAVRDDEGARAAVELAQMTRARRLIESRLSDPALSPETLAAELGMSRASLYRMFESAGGIVEMIREMRLRRGRRMLADPAHAHRTVQSIALECGYASDTAFGRAFKARYGFRPGDVRRNTAGSAGQSAQPEPDRRYEDWLRYLAA